MCRARAGRRLTAKLKVPTASAEVRLVAFLLRLPTISFRSIITKRGLRPHRKGKTNEPT